MTVTWVHFLIVCPAVFVAGFIDAIAGGGGLISLPMYLVAGLPTHFALGTNKLGSCMGTSIATLRYARSGFIPWKLGIVGVIMGLLGSNLGARIALLLSDRVFKIVLLGVLPLTAFYAMRSKALDTKKPALPPANTALIVAGCAFVIGIYDGFYGPGTGTFLILLLTGLAHISLREANGITKAINLATNVSAMSVFLLSGNIILPLGIAAGVFSIAGNYLGARFFEKKGAVSVRPVMLIVLALFFVKIISELIK